MPQHVADAYQSVEKSTASGRQLEASALFRTARALQTAKDAWGTPDGQVKLDEALKLNQRLWTFFQAELAADDNPLPLELKASLLKLVEFIDQRTFEVMAFPAPEKVTILININRNIGAGLATTTATAAA
jgi:flagellar protein FlaF